MSEYLQSLYSSSAQDVRASFGEDASRALSFYASLRDFVSGVQPPTESPRTRLLDVGCGSGWSTYGFAESGYDATGIDLNPARFEPPGHDRCTLVEGSATAIPFSQDGFDVVVCYQCLEHVPEPQRALEEMARVCRPGGLVAIVGPNLVTPLPGLLYAMRPSSWRSIGWLRHPAMPRHPFGNTWLEILGFAHLRGAQLIGKLFRGTPKFSMRDPDIVPPFHSDNDACYLCNPVDLIAFFKNRGFRIERRGKPGRPPLAYLLAGGTWVAARKPVKS
jgi:SAM-dependent methyltransferase